MKKSTSLFRAFGIAGALLSIAATASAAIVTTAVNGPSNFPGTYAVSGSDLLQTSALSSATYSGTPGFTSSLPKLYDGDKYTPGGKNSTDGAFVPEVNGINTFVTFVLDTVTNPDGYDLTSVVNLTGSGSGNIRSGQVYDFAVKYVGGGSFTNLFSVTSALTNNINAGNTEVQIFTVNNAGVLASGVAEIRVTYNLYGGSGTEPMFRELDILGSPTVVPEPSAIALLSCGLFGFLAYTRRRRK